MSTLGQYRVGVDFNPDNNKDVTAIKGTAANWIDFLDQFAQRDGVPPEAKRLLAHAATVVEDAAMWSVKAITKRPRE